MAIDTFYNGLSDTDLIKDMIAKDPDFYIQKYEYIGQATYAFSTAGDETMTIGTAQSWAADDLNSTVARNLIVYDDNSKAASAKITDSTSTVLSFDGTDLLLEEDGVTVATLTNGNTYDIYALTPSSIAGQTYGPFAGYLEGFELNINDTIKKFKYGLPAKVVATDLEEREVTLSGGVVNWSDEGWIKAIWGSVAYGSQSSQYSYGIGVPSCGDGDSIYRITLKNEDKNCRTLWTILRKVRFNSQGNALGKSEANYSMIQANADVLYDGFYPDSAALAQIIRIDA